MAKNCLIYETLNGVKEMKATKSGDLMTLSGVFGVCGVRNNNQRVYETSNYSKMVSEMKERIKSEGGIPGELEHPQMMNITLENISHKITDINIDENGVVTGSITLLNTPKGKIAQAIVEGGLPLFISSRATGSVDSKTGNVTLEKISTYDLVGSPGFSEARLNLNENQIAESINESSIYYITEKENQIDEINDMEMKELLERLDSLEAKVNDLVEENEALRTELNEKQDIDLEKLANGIQKWIVEQYSPMVQKWVVEEYSPVVQKWVMEEYTKVNNEDVISEATDNAMDAMKEHIIESLAPAIQEWVVEHYSPEIEKWCVNEFAPGIQAWMVNEYAPNVEKWLNESFAPKMTESMQAMISESKGSNLNAIDETLKILEGIDAVKPTYSRKALITENADEPKFIQEMPAEARVKWDLASNEVKESIMRRAKLYNFVNEGAIERFWNAIDFAEIKPVRSIYEGLEAIEDEYERAIRAKIRAGRFGRK
jgi:regulator of replication initiation timing